MDATLRKVVIAVALLNLAYFGVEFSVAISIGSVSLFADSIDFLEDASVNLLILVALGWSARQRAWVGTGLACLLLAPVSRRARRLRGRLLALGLLLLGMAGAGLGCSNTVNTANQNGTPLGVHTLKINVTDAIPTFPRGKTAGNFGPTNAMLGSEFH